MISSVLFLWHCHAAQWFRWEDVTLQVLLTSGIPKEENLTPAWESLKEDPPECITVEEIESVKRSLQFHKLLNKKRFLFGEKEKQDSNRNMAMEPQLGNSRKSSWPLLKLLSDLGSRDRRKTWMKRGKQTRRLLKRWARFEATGNDSNPKNVRGRDKPNVIKEVLIRSVQSYPENFGKYVNFEVNWSWVRSLYQRMKFSRREAITSRPVMTHCLRNKIKSHSSRNFIKSVTSQHS